MLTARGAGFEEANGALNNTVTFFIPLGDQVTSQGEALPKPIVLLGLLGGLINIRMF